MDHKWEQSWINAAKETIKNIYDICYAPDNLASENLREIDEGEDEISNHLFKKRRTVNKHELQSYLSSELADPAVNVLEWWKVSLYFNI